MLQEGNCIRIEYGPQYTAISNKKAAHPKRQTAQKEKVANLNQVKP
jgi:hypothetical protein